MYKTANQRISDAARRYLEVKDYIVLDEFEHGGMPFIVAEDCGEVVVARLGLGFGRIPEPWRDREMFEEVAASYLGNHDEVDVPVRGDSIDMLVLGDNRALLRHTVNCSSGFNGA